MRRSFMMLLWSFLFFFAAAVMSEAVPGWLESGIFPEAETPETAAEAPSWGAWFLNEGAWLREAVNHIPDSAQRYFADVDGHWFVFDESVGDIPVSCDPPEWYPWQDTPEKRGLAPKGKDELLGARKSMSFSWGEWEDHFGGSFRRINPPGVPLMGAAHLVDGNGSCYVLVVYPGAAPRGVERFPWFPGFPPGWGIEPDSTMLVNKAVE